VADDGPGAAVVRRVRTDGLHVRTTESNRPARQSEQTATMDTIFLTGLTAECIIGIWDWERKVKQKVVIDLEMSTDIRKAAASDHIDDTLDYKKVSKRLLQFVSESEFQLVETLIDRIAQIILTEFDVTAVRIRLNKQGALRGSRDVGIVIERRRADYPAP
jgi:dihydroneopterin aldolase